MRKKLLLMLFACCIITGSATAQLSLRADYFGSSKYKDDDTDKVLGKGSAVVYSADLSIPLSRKMNERNQPTVWGLNLGATYVDLNNKDFTEQRIGDEILDLSVGFSFMTPIGKRWSIISSLGAGIYSPKLKLSNINSKILLANAAVVFIYEIKPNLHIGGGISITNAYGYPMALPALYVNWITDGKIQVQISAMDGFDGKALYALNENIDVGLSLEYSGEVALFEQDGKKWMFSHQYGVGGLHASFSLYKNIEIPITAGVNIIRSASYDRVSLKSVFSSKEKGGYFDIGPYFSAGISLNFNN